MAGDHQLVRVDLERLLALELRHAVEIRHFEADGRVVDAHFDQCGHAVESLRRDGNQPHGSDGNVLDPLPLAASQQQEREKQQQNVKSLHARVPYIILQR